MAVIISFQHIEDGNLYSKSVPYHFGYDTVAESLPDNYSNGEQIFIIEKDKEFDSTYYLELIKYRCTSEDFMHIRVDCGLERLLL